MAFMEPEVYGPTTGVIVETSGGSFVFPSFVWDDFENKTDLVGTERIYGIVKVRGYFGRYSASGYLDCTDWMFDKDEETLEAELREMYGDDEEEEEEETE